MHSRAWRKKRGGESIGAKDKQTYKAKNKTCAVVGVVSEAVAVLSVLANPDNRNLEYSRALKAMLSRKGGPGEIWPPAKGGVSDMCLSLPAFLTWINSFQWDFALPVNLRVKCILHVVWEDARGNINKNWKWIGGSLKELCIKLLWRSSPSPQAT